MWRRVCFLFIFCTALIGCSSAKQQEIMPENTPVSEYCGRYFFYQVCARDLNDDAIVDVSFFPEGRQVMLYSPEITTDELTQAELTFHPCAQVMDAPLIEASSQLLWASDNPKLLKKAKNDLLSHYLRYLPDVTACNARLAVGGGQKEPDSFGEEDF